MICKLLVNFLVAIKVNKKSMCGLPIKKKEKKKKVMCGLLEIMKHNGSK